MSTDLETNGGTHGTAIVRPAFTCERELFDKDDFQKKQGRFLPGMVDEREHRREWQGNQVHTLTLRWAGMQVLRVLADSAEEAERLMARRIEESFFADWRATQVSTTQAADLARYRQIESDLLETILAKVGRRYESQFGSDAFAIARHMINTGGQK